MEANPVIAALGRRLRLGMIGGGPGSRIGEVHRIAARIDDRYELVASVLSSDGARSRERGQALGLTADRAYPTAEEMFRSEASRPDGIDVVAIMTPNDTHYPLSRAALESGFDVICDKPLATSLADAVDLVRRVRDSGLVFCLTFNHSGYPMIRQARAMIARGLLGEVRMAHFEYLQGHIATRVEEDAPEALGWRLDPARTGPSLVLADIGSHAHHIVTYVTGLAVSQVCAELGAVVPGRRVDDYAGGLLRFENGARGVMWATQAAAGARHGLSLRVFGERGGVEWRHAEPNRLRHMPMGEPPRELSRAGPGQLPEAARAARVFVGHPEGFHEAFANLYSDAAEAIVARRTGAPADPLALDFPTVEDGARGVRFIEAAVESSRAGGAWVDCALEL
ncbi:MAG: Gfo/Idh/MocA family protein [Alphaproteobacteria bacterium]